jgi:hypothetical protein
MKKMTSAGQPSGYKNPAGSKKASAIKVSQATIDSIKSAGMAAALKKAAGGASAAYVEGVKRMYGASRLNAAQAKVKKAAPGSGSGTVNPKQAGPKGASTSYSPAPKKASTSYSPVKKSAASDKKKSKTTDPLAKFAFAVGRAAANPFKSPKK